MTSVQSGYVGRHPSTILTREDGSTVTLCGATWCTGDCGLPQGRSVDGRRVAGIMSAMAPVLQGLREWHGPVVELTEAETAALGKAWWF